MKLVRFETTEFFRYLWLKYVTDFDLSVHCARCLIGQYSRIFPFRGRVTEMYNEPLEEHTAKWLYLCGVSNRYENNLHIAFEEAEGETLFYDDGKTIVEIEGARQIPIVQLESYPLEEKGNLKEYNTCRNWRFAYQMTHGTK